MTRFPPIDAKEVTRPEAQAPAEPGLGAIAGFYDKLAISPELAERVRNLMEHLKVGLHLPEPLRALAVLVAASEYGANSGRIFLDMPDIQAAGLPSTISEAILAGEKPARMTAEQALVYGFCVQVRANGRVDNKTFEAAASRFGRTICLEIAVLMGSVRTASMLANVMRHP